MHPVPLKSLSICLQTENSGWLDFLLHFYFSFLLGKLFKEE